MSEVDYESFLKILGVLAYLYFGVNFAMFIGYVAVDQEPEDWRELSIAGILGYLVFFPLTIAMIIFELLNLRIFFIRLGRSLSKFLAKKPFRR
jgi:hypothetical protein